MNSTHGASSQMPTKKILEPTPLHRQWWRLQRDLFQEKTESRFLDEKVSKDHLTGLYNRRFAAGYYDKLSASILRNRPDNRIGVVYFDADHFKSINDTHGHDVGDDALRYIAAVMKEVARDEDVPFRQGGEEFGVLLEIDKGSPEEQQKIVKSIAERIRRKLERRPFTVKGGEELSVTASFGVSVVDPADGLSMAESMDQVDSCLYLAKKNGRNCIAELPSAGGKPSIATVHLDDEEKDPDVAIVKEHLEDRRSFAPVPKADFEKELRAVKKEITSYVKSNVVKKDLTNTDELTGALSRRGGEEHYDKLHDAMVRSRPDGQIGALLLDIDHFKKVNDTYGHHIGDMVLKHFTKTIEEVARKEDTLIRYGGEEFVLITEEKSIKGMARFAQRLRKKIQETPFDLSPHLKGGGNLPITASIGAYLFNPSDKPHSFIEASKEADKAMYVAKENRNSVATNVNGEFRLFKSPDNRKPTPVNTAKYLTGMRPNYSK